jgi:hypothetical protein
MRRLRDYCRFVAWQAGLGYLLLWAVTFWTLDEGASVFGKSGVCFPDEAKVLFYWVCDPASPLTILASLANAALTATVWAPVYLAAATAEPGAITIAGPIIALHLIGLPLALFVLIRLLAAAFDLRRWVGWGCGAAPEVAAATPHAVAAQPPVVAAQPPAATTAVAPLQLPPRARLSPRPKVKARSEFGLRGQGTGDGRQITSG